MKIIIDGVVCKVYGLRFGVVEFQMVQCSGFRVQGSGFRVEG